MHDASGSDSHMTRSTSPATLTRQTPPQSVAGLCHRAAEARSSRPSDLISRRTETSFDHQTSEELYTTPVQRLFPSTARLVVGSRRMQGSSPTSVLTRRPLFAQDRMQGSRQDAQSLKSAHPSHSWLAVVRTSAVSSQRLTARVRRAMTACSQEDEVQLSGMELPPRSLRQFS